ncbi:MAG: 3'-5' exonuclease [Firmicutes bacterium]|nr:3'-5' exonuclease [Bacillota bacterium]
MFQEKFNEKTKNKYKEKLFFKEVLFSEKEKRAELIFSTLSKTGLYIESNRKEIENACRLILPSEINLSVVFEKSKPDKEVLEYDVANFLKTTFPSVYSTLIKKIADIKTASITLTLDQNTESYVENTKLPATLQKYLYKSYSKEFSVDINFGKSKKASITGELVQTDILGNDFDKVGNVVSGAALGELDNLEKEVAATLFPQEMYNTYSGEAQFSVASIYASATPTASQPTHSLKQPKPQPTTNTSRLSLGAGPSLKGTYIVFDIETTGLEPTLDTIIELAAVKLVDGVVVDTFSELIDPKIPLPAKITEITGLKDADLKGKPTLDKILPKFFEFCNAANTSGGFSEALGSIVGGGEATLVGHNSIKFDFPFVDYHARKQGIVFKNKVLDTLQLSRQKLRLMSYRLENVARSLGVSLINAHRALDDATATAEIFVKLYSSPAR